MLIRILDERRLLAQALIHSMKVPIYERSVVLSEVNCPNADIEFSGFRPIAVIGYLAHPELCQIGWG